MDGLKEMELTIVPQGDVALITEIQKCFENLPLGMSAYQIKNGVLNGQEFPTPDSKYWQCLRELYVRYNSIVETQYQYNKMKLEIELLGIEKDSLMRDSYYHKEADMVRAKMKELDVAYKELMLGIMEKNLSDTIRQMRIFYEQMKENDKDRKYKTTNKEDQEDDFWRIRKKLDSLKLLGGNHA